MLISAFMFFVVMTFLELNIGIHNGSVYWFSFLVSVLISSTVQRLEMYFNLAADSVHVVVNLVGYTFSPQEGNLISWDYSVVKKVRGITYYDLNLKRRIRGWTCSSIRKLKVERASVVGNVD
jgi:hypothetical protein